MPSATGLQNQPWENGRKKTVFHPMITVIYKSPCMLGLNFSRLSNTDTYNIYVK